MDWVTHFSLSTVRLLCWSEYSLLMSLQAASESFPTPCSRQPLPVCVGHVRWKMLIVPDKLEVNSLKSYSGFTGSSTSEDARLWMALTLPWFTLIECISRTSPVQNPARACGKLWCCFAVLISGCNSWYPHRAALQFGGHPEMMVMAMPWALYPGVGTHTVTLWPT